MTTLQGRVRRCQANQGSDVAIADLSGKTCWLQGGDKKIQNAD